jgi:hypothetical protein
MFQARHIRAAVLCYCVLALCLNASAEPPKTPFGRAPQSLRPQSSPAGTQAPAAQAPELAPQIEADTLPQPVGVYGTVFAQVGDVRCADLLLHEDTQGRAPKQLLEVCASSGHGFAAVWRDLRDGHAGLYFGRLDLDGNLLEPERALYPAGSSAREVEPAIALAPRGNGALVWHTSNNPPHPLRLRSFDAAGVLTAQVVTLSDVNAESRRAGRATALAADGSDARRAGGGARLPSLAMLESWGAVAWGDAGTLRLERFDPNGRLLGEVHTLSAPDRALSGPPQLCASGATNAAMGCAWTTREGVEFCEIGAEIGAPRKLGPGVLERLVASPADSGDWWALVKTSSGFRLVGVPRSGGELKNLDLGVSARERCDVAARSADFLLCVQPASGAVELSRLDPFAASPRLEKLGVLDPADTLVSDVRVVAAGDRALLVWSGALGLQRDVWLRSFDAQSKFGPAKRWNSDEASAPQTQVRIASRGGNEAVTAWLDGRSGQNELYVRVIGADGKFQSAEVVINPAASASDGATGERAGQPSDPALAMAAGGQMLVAWKHMEPRGYRLLAQALDSHATASSPILAIDAGQDAAPTFKADIAATAFARGFALAYSVKDRGVFVRKLSASGGGLSEPVQVGEHPICQNVSIAQLDGGNLAVAWDISVPGAPNKAVRARVLDAELRTLGAEIEPPLSLFGDDWDPSVSSCPGGGFAIAFTGGQAHSRDIFLRYFEASGALASPLVPISTRMNEQDFAQLARLSDGSLCAVWEDDLSAYDHVYVRRISRGPKAGELPLRGPCFTLNEREALLNENRGAPQLAPLAGGGFAAVWVDCRRSQGTDVRIKIVGPKFDASGR